MDGEIAHLEIVDYWIENRIFKKKLIIKVVDNKFYITWSLNLFLVFILVP